MKHSFIALGCVVLLACGGGDGSPDDSATADDDAGGSSTPPTLFPGDAGTPVTSQDGAVSPLPMGGDGGGAGDAQSPPSDGGSNSGGVFDGEGAYMAMLGPSARNGKHTGSPNPAGQACLGCHGGQHPNVVEFLFAGTVWSDAAGTKPSASSEVRIRESNGTATSVYTDADGNFFYPKGARGPLAAPVHGGARDAKTTLLMNNVFSEGDCNSCHRTGGEGPLALP